MIFKNRVHAGTLLAEKISGMRFEKPCILALLRGGIVVGEVIAETLKLPLIPFIIKKISAPNNPELALGAVTFGGENYIDWEMVNKLGVGEKYLAGEIDLKSKILKDYTDKFQIKPTFDKLSDYKTAIIVDDGVATGATALTAGSHLRNSNAEWKIVLAVGVISKDIYQKLKKVFDEVIAIEIPVDFQAVGQFYHDFAQVEDSQVIEILQRN
jgi:predicted phosphoribosyltransferase